MRLQVAKETTPGAAALLDEATGELQTAIGEVRGLARGIHPTILTEAGLRAAVDALAERTPLPVTVDIPDRRFDPQVEATAYFVIAEALTNVARYAEATEARVATVEGDGRLVVTVADDGRGGADPAAGSGLRGLADRLAAVDGRLTVSSPAGGGTIIRAELPLIALTARRPRRRRRSGSPAATCQRACRAGGSSRSRRRDACRLSSPAVPDRGRGRRCPGGCPGRRGARTLRTRPVDGRADDFVRPFDYQFPAGANVDGSIRIRTVCTSCRRRPGGCTAISIWAVDDVWWTTARGSSSDPPRGQPAAARRRWPARLSPLRRPASTSHG